MYEWYTNKLSPSSSNTMVVADKVANENEKYISNLFRSDKTRCSLSREITRTNESKLSTTLFPLTQPSWLMPIETNWTYENERYACFRD